MDLGLSQKTALVTGASSGLGFACAKQLSKQGVCLLVSSRGETKLQAAAAKLSNETGNDVFAHSADLTKQEDVSNLLSAAQSLLGHVDILVFSTGHPPTYSLLEASDVDWELGSKLILQPAIALSKGLLCSMKAKKYGRLIFIGSIFGIEPEHSSIVQSTLRTGLNAFSKCISREFAASGITSNVICPGYFDTPLVRNLAQKYADRTQLSVDQVIDQWKNFSPSRKFGKPEDLGAFVSFLSSPRGEFINGTSIVVDGGALRSY